MTLLVAKELACSLASSMSLWMGPRRSPYLCSCSSCSAASGPVLADCQPLWIASAPASRDDSSSRDFWNTQSFCKQKKGFVVVRFLLFKLLVHNLMFRCLIPRSFGFSYFVWWFLRSLWLHCYQVYISDKNQEITILSESNCYSGGTATAKFGA